jgi:putative intracellular protease/amidase
MTAYSDKEEAFNELLWYDMIAISWLDDGDDDGLIISLFAGETACRCTLRTLSRTQEVRLWSGPSALLFDNETDAHVASLVTGQYEARWPLMPNVVEDRELITGQGPTSAWRFGEALLAALNTYNLSRVQSAPSVY